MMDEVRFLLERHARWQRSRQLLSWSEKVRIAESVRESVLQLRRAPTKRGTSSESSVPSIDSSETPA
jgi:hypothetical protein